MTLRVGEQIIAGGGPIKDNVTITQNEDSQIQTIGKINQNQSESATPVLYDWVGTLQEYYDQNIEEEHPTWICFITDDDPSGTTTCLTLLEYKWSDRLLDDTRWVNSNNFEWQDGRVYQTAYLHLWNDLYETDVNLYCWASSTTSKIIYTKTETPIVNTMTYDENGIQWKAISSVSENEIDVLNPTAGEEGPYIRNSTGDTTITVTNATQITETISGTTITYFVAQDGHRICMPDQEAAAATIYEDTGLSWFYILDTANTRFKLPRERGNDEDKKYLYFFVGEFTESALKNTAGITAETLNSKMDAEKFQVVTSLPANPDPSVFYFLIN